MSSQVSLVFDTQKCCLFPAMRLDKINHVTRPKHVYMKMYIIPECFSSPAGALHDFDKTNVPPATPEAQAAPDTGAKTEEKVVNTVSVLLMFHTDF